MTASLRHALRSLRRSPTFSPRIIATPGIGIGLNIANLPVMDCILRHSSGCSERNAAMFSP